MDPLQGLAQAAQPITTTRNPMHVHPHDGRNPNGDESPHPRNPERHGTHLGQQTTDLATAIGPKYLLYVCIYVYLLTHVYIYI